MSDAAKRCESNQCIEIQELTRPRCAGPECTAENHAMPDHDSDEVFAVIMRSTQTGTGFQANIGELESFMLDVIGGLYDKYLPEAARMRSVQDEDVKLAEMEFEADRQAAIARGELVSDGA